MAWTPFTPLPDQPYQRLDYRPLFMAADARAKAQGAAASAIPAVSPTGLTRITDIAGQKFAIGDRERVMQAQDAINQGTADIYSQISSQGIAPSTIDDIRALNQMYQSQVAPIEQIAKQREEGYNKIREQVAADPHINVSPWRAMNLLTEEELMLENPNYIPEENITIGEHVDRQQVMREAINNIETFKSAYANTNRPGYIQTGTKEFRTRERIEDVYDLMLLNTGLIDDLNQEAEYKVRTGQIPADYAPEYVNIKRQALKEQAVLTKETEKRTAGLGTDSTFFKFKEEEEERGGTDIIDAGTWLTEPFTKAVYEAGEGFFGKIFGAGPAPKYDQFVTEIEDVQNQLNAAKAQQRKNDEEGITDTALNQNIENLEHSVSDYKNITDELDKQYNAYLKEAQKYKDDPLLSIENYIDPNWDEDTKGEVRSRLEHQLNQTADLDKAEFFEANMDAIAGKLTNYQKGVSIPNEQLDLEIKTGVSSQGGKRAFSQTHKQLTPEVTIPTGYVTKTSEGVMNLAWGYFLDEDEAEKAGIEVEEIKGNIANDAIKQSVAAAGSRGVTIPAYNFNADDNVYRVKVFTDTRTQTAADVNDMLYNKEEQQLSNKLNDNINKGRGGLEKISGNVSVGHDARGEGSYYVVVNDGKDTREIRYATENEAIKKALLYDKALK